jgi:vancomycin resistance protein YoaR
MNPKNKLIAIFFILTIFLCSWLVSIGYNKSKISPNIILPNIYLDQVYVGNLTKKQAGKTLAKKYPKIDQFNISLWFEKKEVAVIPAKKLKYQLPVDRAIDQAYLVGRGQGLSALYQRIALNLGWERYNFELDPVYDHEYLQNILEELALGYKKEPVDARFDFQDNKVLAFKKEENGYEMEITDTQLQIEKAISQQRDKPVKKVRINIPKKVLTAKVRLAEINNLGINELVGQGSSYFAGSAPERVHNISTGANKINGLIIKPEQIFSFDEFLGEISSRTGFASAYVIKNGKTVLDDGGGICQVSTTMFRAALNAGLPIIERTAHAYRVGYYEQDSKPGFDATIYLPSVDLKFKNDYPSSLLIQTEVDTEQMRLTISLYGTKDARQIELSEINMWNIAAPPEPEYVDDFALPAGVVKQIDFEAWGTSAKFSYKVTYPNGEVNEQEFVSNFRPWRAIYLVGKKTD